MNYHNKKFKVISNSKNGAISSEMIFHYQQVDNIVSCNYANKNIKKGFLLGSVDGSGKIQMTYQQINSENEIMTGICTSIPKIENNGTLRLYEKWQWTTGDNSSGTSILEEVL